MEDNSVSGTARVQQGGVWSNAVVFSVGTATISNVMPASGAPGTQVTITGPASAGPRAPANGVLRSWSDTLVVAAVAGGSATGQAQVLQGGLWSNAVAFTVNTPSLTSVDPASAVPGVVVTLTGSGFGATQGSGAVWLGSAAGQVVTWSDTAGDGGGGRERGERSRAGAAGRRLVERPGVHGTWRGHDGDAGAQPGEPGGGRDADHPGDRRQRAAADQPGLEHERCGHREPLDGRSASTDGDGGGACDGEGGDGVGGRDGVGGDAAGGDGDLVKPGQRKRCLFHCAGGAEPDGVADVFAFQGDGTVQAITSEGKTAWTADVSMAGPVVPDFQGGLVGIAQSGYSGAIVKWDGMTGQRGPAYTPSGTLEYALGVHTDGTVLRFRGIRTR